MSSFAGPIGVPKQFVYNINYEAEKIDFHSIVPIPLMHSCIESNTYVLDVPMGDGDDVKDLHYDLYELNNTPLPFGQIVILSYYRNGEFLIECATERYKPHLVEEAFRSFGYTDVKIKGNYMCVSEKDEFKLKLKYGVI